MIKPRCPICNSIYLDPACPCREGRKPHNLECECGKPASEIYVDKLGEWPLCSACLELELDEFAPLPLPDYKDEDDPLLLDERIPLAASDTYEPLIQTPLPFDLTAREYQVALLAHLSYQQIAARLKLSEWTVKAHFKSVLQKLGIRSKHEIPHVLRAAESGEKLETRAPAIAVDWSSAGIPSEDESLGRMLTVTLTITGKADRLREILSLLLER
jgi:DNA-binding CsgD family transcriptional regulator